MWRGCRGTWTVPVGSLRLASGHSACMPVDASRDPMSPHGPRASWGLCLPGASPVWACPWTPHFCRSPWSILNLKHC